MARTKAELEVLVAMAEVMGNDDDFKQFTQELHDLKKKDAKHGRRK